MKVLGISAFYHDSAACLVEDGEIVAAAQEERFTRVKHDAGFPGNAVRYCLAEGGIGDGGLDAVVFYDKPILKFHRLLETYLSAAPRGLSQYLTAIPLWLKDRLWVAPQIQEALARCGVEPPGRVHFAEHQQSTDQIPLSRLMGPAVVIDVSRQADSSADFLVPEADLTAWEAAHGPIPAGSIVMVRTGWGRRWPDRARYLGTTKTGTAGVAELHFPGLSLDAARGLVRRGVKAVGIDTPSIDYGQSTTYLVHRELFASNIPAFENVAQLDKLPVTGAYVIALPMKIGGGSGGPLRIAALLP